MLIRRRPRRERRSVRLAFGLTVSSAALFVCAFAVFAVTVSGSIPPADPRADGIVVLTGAPERIDRGLRLLAEGRGTRLLITGVDARIDRETLARSIDQRHRAMLDCCTDFDHAADTVENAAGAKRWAESFGFRSLIVVTSDYHMPRSLAELALLMPDRTLIAYPISEKDGGEANPRMMRLLFAEFLKYLAVRMRQIIDAPANSSSQVHVARGGTAS